MTYKSFKVELHPNNAQRTGLAKACGCARVAYNWMLGTLKEDRESGENKFSPNAIQMHKELVKLKKAQFDWMYETSKCAPQYALRNCAESYQRFFKGHSKFPRFKKKGCGDSASFDGAVNVTETHVQIPKIGKVRLKERGYVPVGKPKKITVSKQADRWFVSIGYQIESEIKDDWTNEIIGVDLGIKELATCSDGSVYSNSGKLNKKTRQLKSQQSKLSKKTKGSNNYKKQRNKLTSIHKKISDHRKDLLHKTTTDLARTKQAGIIVIEDLNVSGMMKNHNLARSIANCGFYEFRRQLEYKCKWYGKELVVINRWFPSSKMCSSCGTIKEDLKLSDRVYKCDCGHVEDRDMNAAKNIASVGKTMLESSIP